MDSAALECLDCDHRGLIERSLFERFTGECLNVNSLSAAFTRFRCTGCGGKRLRIMRADGELLFDAAQEKPCRGCGDPIPLPRLRLLPGAAWCAICADEAADPRPAPAHPQPPNKDRTCPRCDWGTEVRQNRTDGSFFISCTRFGCGWTKDYPGR